MSYIVYAWLCSVTYGLGSIVGKIAARHQIANPWLYNFVWALLTVVCIAPFAIGNGVGLPQEWTSMLWLGLANAVSGLLFIFAFYALDLSVLSPLANLRTPLVALSGVLFLGEVLLGYQWALIILVFVAGLFVNIDERMSMRKIFNKKLGIALIWILSSVWFNSSIKYASEFNGFWEVSLWSSVITLLLYIPMIPMFYRDAVKTPITRYSGVVMTTILYTAGLLFSVKALSENVGISMAIISLPLTLVMTIVLSRFKPKLLEKHSARVYTIRFVSAAVMFAAALGLSK